MSDQEPVRCPRCDRELGALARFCWRCQDYVDDQEPDPEGERIQDEIHASVSEEDLRHDVVRFLRSVGYAVWDLEQGYRPKVCPSCGGKIGGGSRQTKGVADLLVAGHGETFFVELKTPAGRRSEPQIVFRDEIENNGGRVYLWRSTRAAVDHYQERRRESRE